MRFYCVINPPQYKRIQQLRLTQVTVPASESMPTSIHPSVDHFPETEPETRKSQNAHSVSSFFREENSRGSVYCTVPFRDAVESIDAVIT